MSDDREPTWRVTYCDCGCRTVRLEAFSDRGRPVLHVFDAEQVAALASHLLASSFMAAEGKPEQQRRTH